MTTRLRPSMCALAMLLFAAASCTESVAPPVYQSARVERRDIIVSAQAAGVIEPEVIVEVKSKTSGEILEMRVDTGDRVEQGSLLLRIDSRQPRNKVAEAEAEGVVGRARLANAESQLRRAERLFRADSMSASDHDQAVLDVANAKAGVVRAEIALENARIELEDADVHAPIAGTVLIKNVERGQVISSATSDVSGGTILLHMADLQRVRVRAMVDETDIGKVELSLPVSVVVAAYPDREFEGSVLKIEPQSITEQNVTMFPVLVAVDNPDGSLKPGMNAEVEIHVNMRRDALAIPNASLRTERDFTSAAEVLGLSIESVREALGESGGGKGGGQSGAATQRDAARHYIVFVKRESSPRPVRIRAGLTDLDYSEVLQGLEEGEAVLILPSASLMRSQQQFKERINRVRGDGLPGMKKSGGKAGKKPGE